MDQDSKYHLSFSNFESSTSTEFQNLFTNSDFTDVTLACGDDGQIQAHKVILSSMSPFFHKILSNNPHPHPLIFLKGIRQNELKKIINFIYKGETEVDKADLKRFMNSANELEINGLQTSDYKANVEVETGEFETQRMRKYEKERHILLKKDDEIYDIEEVNIANKALKFSDNFVADIYDGNPLDNSFAEGAQTDGSQTSICNQCDYETTTKVQS